MDQLEAQLRHTYLITVITAYSTLSMHGYVVRSVLSVVLV